MQSWLNTLHTKFVFQRRVKTLAKVLSEMIPTGARVLDVGCGNGQLSAQVATLCDKVSIAGIDVLLRPERYIEVTEFDGTTIPFANSSFDVVMFVDVLHHTNNPDVLLAEARRVTRRYVLVKDHFRTGFLAYATLRLMDWFGNVHHGVALPYNYLSESEWSRLYHQTGLTPVKTIRKFGLYPLPFNWLFGRSLHFVALLKKRDRIGVI
jgi:ubiquinone/menaquinone biosynthesis C-methylase UbiE